MFLVLATAPGGTIVHEFDDAAVPLAEPRPIADLAGEVLRREPERPRWVWSDTSTWYPPLLAAGVRVERCVDLRLGHAILRASAFTATSDLATAPRSGWDAAAQAVVATEGALFDLEPAVEVDPVAEFRLQRAAIDASDESGRLNLLLAAESAGAVIAAEMRFAGLPWRADLHEAVLTDLLGPRPPDGQRPAKLGALLAEIRGALDGAEVNPDSPPELVRQLRRAGIAVDSARSWDLQRIDHPAIPPLLHYKKLSRLWSANGWHWLDRWVADGRFRPDYVPGGVVTGRWATNGGGALQLPKQIRAAVVADPGWKLVVADAAQLEPRILTALAGDRGMAEAGRGKDLYAGIVASGAVATRDQAKVAMLGAMYGATTGESGRLMPRLTRAFPRAIALVEEAARAGERGEIVSTRLGRSSPPGAEPGYDETATGDDVDRAKTRARAWGRFTRNFIVQGTAAEWALCWMAGLRPHLRTLGGDAGLTREPHLVFFLHDEIVVHTPAELAEDVVAAIEQAAAGAGRLLFGAMPVSFPLTIAVVDDYGSAK